MGEVNKQTLYGWKYIHTSWGRESARYDNEIYVWAWSKPKYSRFVKTFTDFENSNFDQGNAYMHNEWLIIEMNRGAVKNCWEFEIEMTILFEYCIHQPSLYLALLIY